MKKFLFSLVAISSIVTLAFSFEKGDTVYICMSNSSTCKAIMIMEGSDESKVELRESCTVALFTMKSEGEQIWAPNRALTSVDGDCK